MIAGIDRHLSVLLAADVAGYSVLMRRAEEETLGRLLAARKLMDALVDRYGGRIVNSVGDSVLAEFDSVVAAVQSALHIQRAIADAAKDVAQDRRLLFRIGIQVGEVMVSGNDIYGDGVNVAARLQALAPPGGITVSGAVFDQLRDRFGLPFEDLGEQSVKNIDRPVPAYGLSQAAIVQLDDTLLRPPRVAAGRRMRSRAAALAALMAIAAAGAWAAWELRWPAFVRSAEAPGPALKTLSIAIARDDGAGPSKATDSLQREFHAELARQGGDLTLYPVDRRGLDRPLDLQEQARRMGARYFLSETYFNAPSAGVELQLLGAQDASQQWRQRFDLGAPRDEAARRKSVRLAVAQLHQALVELETRRVLAEPRAGQGAAELALRGWAALLRGPREQDLLEARDLFRQALDMDPNHVMSLRGAIMVGSNLADLDPRYDRASLSVEVERMSARAVNADSRNAGAWRSRGYALENLGRHEAAMQAMAHAIELSPEGSLQYIGMASLLNSVGRPQAALEQLSRAQRLSPQFEDMVARHRCESLLLLGQLQQAVQACERAVALGQGDGFAQVLLAAAYANLGEAKKAELAKAAVLQAWPHWTVGWFRAAYVNPTPERTALAEPTLFAGLSKAGMPP